nr:MAG TPA: hypothetical protein [Caudoviricetes sp.]
MAKFIITLICYAVMMICNITTAIGYSHSKNEKSSKICYASWFISGALAAMFLLWLLAQILVK